MTTADDNPADDGIHDALAHVNVYAFAEHARAIVDAAPPLTAQQRDQLAALLWRRPCDDIGAAA